LQSQSTESKGGAIVRGRALFLWQRVHTLALTRLTARASSHVPSYTSSKSSLVSSCPDDGETRQAHIAIITGRRTKLHGNILMGIGESVIWQRRRLRQTAASVEALTAASVEAACIIVWDDTDYDVAAPPLGAHCASWGEETWSGSGTSSTGTIRLSTMLFVPLFFSADTRHPVARAQHRGHHRAAACEASGRTGASGGLALGWLRTRPAAVHVAHAPKSICNHRSTVVLGKSTMFPVRS